MATTGYSAGTDTTDVVCTYALEATWGTAPATAGQIIRMNSEGFGKTKTRTRPNEINTTGQVSAAVTTATSTKGDLKVSISAGSHFELLCASLMGVAGDAVNMSAATIAATADGFTDSGNHFIDTGKVTAGAWINVKGFTAPTANGYYQVLTVAAGAITTLPAPGATETATNTITITGTKVKNGTTFQSVYFQKQLATALFLGYPGSFPTGGGISASTGGMWEGTLSFLSKDEVNGTTTAHLGANTAATLTPVIDTVAGFGDIYRGASKLAGVITKVDVSWSQSAREQRGMGSSATQGIGKGLIEVKGSIEMYFKDFTLYTEAANETASMLSFRAIDSTGAGYIVTLGSCTLMNPKIVAGGPSTDVMATFEIEGNPTLASSIFGGATIQIDKMV